MYGRTSVHYLSLLYVCVGAQWLSGLAADIRYSLFRIGLEAVFGPDANTGEITYKLSQRTAFFISDTPQAARHVFSKARKC